jgi:malate permease and related proteins
MTVLLLLLGKLLPLYILIGLGIVAGNWLNIQREPIAKLLLYIVVPAVIFYGSATVEINQGIIMLVPMIFVIAVVLSTLSWLLARVLVQDHRSCSILGFTCGTGNNGYFGLPLAVALLGEKAFPIVVISGMGFLLYEVTFGFLWMAGGPQGIRLAVSRVLKFPLPYAFALGILWNLSGWPLPQVLVDLGQGFRAAYSIFGMMFVGLSLPHVRHLFSDVRFTLLAIVAKHIGWPLLAWVLVLIDRTWLHLLTPIQTQVLLVLAVVPLAANTVAYATEFKLHPEKAAAAVFISTAATVVLIPISMLALGLTF